MSSRYGFPRALSFSGYSSAATFANIAPGDVVTYRNRYDPPGKVRHARAVIVRPDHVTCDAGGRYGTPVVVNSGNYVSHRPGRE